LTPDVTKVLNPKKKKKKKSANYRVAFYPIQLSMRRDIQRTYSTCGNLNVLCVFRFPIATVRLKDTDEVLCASLPRKTRLEKVARSGANNFNAFSAVPPTLFNETLIRMAEINRQQKTLFLKKRLNCWF